MPYPNTFPVHTPHIAAPGWPAVIRLPRRIFVHYWRRSLIILASLTVVLLAIQIIYPSSRALPFTKIGNRSVGLAGQGSINAALGDLQQQPITVTTILRTYSTTLFDMGIEIDKEASLKKVTDYPLSKRLTPMSIFFQADDKQTEQIVVRVNESKLDTFTQKIIEENTRAPIEGSVVIDGISVSVKPPQNGINYDPEEVAAILRGAGTFTLETINLPATTSSPIYSRAVLDATATKAQAMLSQSITVTTIGQQQRFEPTTIAGWISFIPDPSTKTMTIELNRGLIKNALRDHAAVIHLAPGWTNISNSLETTRTPGTSGRMLAADETAEAVVVALNTISDSAAGVLAQIPPSAGNTRDYPHTSIGLQYLLDDWYSRNSGAKWGIVVKELGNKQRYAAIRQHDQFVTASVYKLFLAYSVLTKIDEGALDSNSVTATGSTVNTCIEYMIVRSQNQCSHALGSLVGWDVATSMQQSRGFSSTSIKPGNLYTTANDTTEILEQLYNGGLMNPTPNARLLDMMKRQVYRNGIPTGSRPSIVANKVGYVDGYTHDVGIVYHPKGAYIVSVLSYGGSYPQIVDLSRTIYNYMSQ